MNGISTNYQINFNGLVPKAKYSGTPKLSEDAIRRIKLLKEYVKTIDNDMLDLEGKLIQQDYEGNNAFKSLKKELNFLSHCRDKYVGIIEAVRKNGVKYPKGDAKVGRCYKNELELLERYLNNSFGNQLKNLR